MTGFAVRSCHTGIAPLSVWIVALKMCPGREAPPLSNPSRPTYTTSWFAPVGWAAMERISVSPLHATPSAPLSRLGLIALALVQPAPLAKPRHTRQVPISSWVESSGSTRNAAGEPIEYPSPFTSASVTTGVVPKPEAAHETGLEQR